MNLFSRILRRCLFLLPLSAQAAFPQSGANRVPASAPSGVHLSVSTTAGARCGTLSELLFRQDKTDGAYKKLSELDWQLAPAVYFGATAELQCSTFDFSVYAGGFLPLRSGIMEDSDWLHLDGVKHIYSINENSISRSFFAGTQAAWNASPIRWLRIRPSLSMEYIRLAFSAENGYGWYGDASHSGTGKDVPWNSESASFFESGKLYGITYTYSAFFTWTGVSAAFYPSPMFSVQLSAECSPFFYAKALDHHLDNSNGVFYLDAIPGVFAAGRAALSLSLYAAKALEISTGVSFTKIGAAFGTSYSSTKSEDGPYAQAAGYQGGTDGQWLDLTISASVRLF